MADQKDILIVEDEADLAELVRFNLEREGYACRCAGDGASAQEQIRHGVPDLIVLDRMLPGTSGDELAARVKGDARTAAVHIIMLTAKADEADELVGFALGVDDYVTKPFSMKKLVARVGAVLRRGGGEEPVTGRLAAGRLVLDPERHELTLDGEAVPTTTTEFKLLAALMASKGRVLSRSQLIDAAMGSDAVVTDRTIDVHITALRKKLGGKSGETKAADWIQTVRGVGYTFRPPAA